MNQQKKRKFSNLESGSLQIKKMKLDSHVTDHSKHKHDKKKKKSPQGSVTLPTGDNRIDKQDTVNKKTVQQDYSKNSEKRKGKNWQSVKEKRKRMKKKYLNTDGKNNTNLTNTANSQTSQKESVTTSDKNTVKLPQNPGEYSSNWKNLMKELNIPKTKKKKKSKDPKIPQTKDGDKKEPEIWFDDVDEILLERQPVSTYEQPDKLVKQESFTGLTRDVAMDCEMVGVGWDGRDNQLARVSIVNHFGNCVFDKYVKPKEAVMDYRTHVSGIRPEDLLEGEELEDVQKEVAKILDGRLLIGHAIHNDLKVLYISHPKKMIRDTSRYKPFRQLFDGRNPSLKKLTAKVLGVAVQEGEHNSVQDAQAAMRLYTMNKKTWEKEIKNKHRPMKKGPKKKKKIEAD